MRRLFAAVQVYPGLSGPVRSGCIRSVPVFVRSGYIFGPVRTVRAGRGDAPASGLNTSGSPLPQILPVEIPLSVPIHSAIKPPRSFGRGDLFCSSGKGCIHKRPSDSEGGSSVGRNPGPCRNFLPHLLHSWQRCRIRQHGFVAHVDQILLRYAERAVVGVQFGDHLLAARVVGQVVDIA